MITFGQEDVHLVALAGFAAFLANMLYMWGGTKNVPFPDTPGQKFWRRFIASFILAITANLVALYLHRWSWQYVFMYPCLIGGFSLPYGTDTIMNKVGKRTIFALGVITACFCGLWAAGFTISGWVVLGLATLIGLTSVVIGVWNPWSSAPLEQFLICQVLCMFIPFWGWVR